MTPTDPRHPLLPKAHALYKAGDFAGAKKAYEIAGRVVGEKLVKANIHLCNLRLDDTERLNQSNRIQADKQSNTRGTTGASKQPAPIRLKRKIEWMTYAVEETGEISITASIDAHGSGKSYIALIKAFDKNGLLIPPEKIKLPFSTIHKCSFTYFNGANNERKEITAIRSEVNYTRIDLGLALFECDPSAPAAFVKDIRIEKILKKIQIKTAAAVPKAKLTNEFKVAIIADEFTTNSFEGEFAALPVEPSNWEEVFEEGKPDLFFCESAWSGPDSTIRPWQGKIYASLNFQKENRGTLLDILTYCRKKDIPTVFWNKEDPTHHHDRIHDFTKTASLFDHVFTSAEECIESYRSLYGVKRVTSLPFATNPRLFNPIESGERADDIVFAGSWYANHAERCRDMEDILSNLLRIGFNLRIYDRYHNSPDFLHTWPSRYQSFILPAKPHQKMPFVYKSSRFGLNINTVKNSSTMFARRVFELMSSNTLVISNYSKGVDKMFGEMVVFADRDPVRLKSLERVHIENMRHNALHKVLRNHTYKKRWNCILNELGLPFRDCSITLSFVFVIRTRDEALGAISWYQQYARSFEQSQILLLADINMDPLEISSFYQEFNRLGVTVTSMLHANKYALAEYYQPARTTHFVGIHAGAYPDTKRIDNGILHFQYVENQFLALASSPDQRYKYMPTSFDTAIIGNSKQLTDWIGMVTNRESIQAYCV